MKKWAVKTKNMKFQSKTFDFNHCKLKFVTERVCDTKKKMANSQVHLGGKIVYRKAINIMFQGFIDTIMKINEFCNCEIMDCISKREQIEQEIHDREKVNKKETKFDQ